MILMTNIIVFYVLDINLYKFRIDISIMVEINLSRFVVSTI